MDPQEVIQQLQARLEEELDVSLLQ